MGSASGIAGTGAPRERANTRTTPGRPGQPLAAKEMKFDLAGESLRLRGEAAYATRGRNAVTLVKYPDLRVVLTALASASRVGEHKTEGRVSIHLLSGELRVHVAGEPVDLNAGQILALDAGVAHDAVAVKDSVFLLTVALTGK